MNEVETLNRFFARTDLTETESKLRERCQVIKTKLDSSTAELQTKRTETLQKDEEVRALTHQMEGLLQFALELETAKSNTQATPTTPTVEAIKE